MKKSLVSMLLALTLVVPNSLPIFAASKVPTVNLYVAVDGDDTNQGTMDAPFRTLEGARDYIREMKANGMLPQGGVEVHIREGQYVLGESFELSSEDSGLETAPIIYKAYNDEQVSITGGYALDAAQFTHVTNSDILARLDPSVHEKVMEINLADQGITSYGEMPKKGFGWSPVPPAPELFIDGETATIARYPNEGFLKTGSTIRQGFIPRDHMSDTEPNQPSHDCPPESEWINQEGPIFKYTDDKLDKWAEEDEIWLFGYWKWDWADDNLKVTMDPINNTFTAAHPSRYGLNGSGSRYYAYNLLCEIDQPGEWYLDRSSGMLYIYPQGDITQSKVELSVLDKPLINMEDASNIIFEDLTFEISRSHGIKMMNGENNLVAGCTFRQLGEMAVKIGDPDAPGVFNGTMLLDSEAGGGRNNGVVSCDIYDTGAGGISIAGGDRVTLEAGNNYAHNNKIYNYARLIRTYRPAIDMIGVGNRATNNLIFDAPHMAIQFRGNDLVIENNEIYDVCQETADAGVIYTARDWTYRGNVINNNFIHDITTLGGLVSYAVYFDDLMSSATMTNNVFYNIDNSALLLGGGRDFVMENNMFINSKQIAHIDNRAQGWANYHAEAPNGTCYVTLKNVMESVDHDVWREAYGEGVFELWDMFSTTNKPAQAKIPANNTFKNNISLNGGTMNVASSAKLNGNIQDPIKVTEDENVGFVDQSGLNFSLKEDSVIFEKLPEFKSIDFKQIGLIEDQYREIDQTPLESFRITTPMDGAQGIEPQDIRFEWESVEDAMAYEVVIAKDKEFKQIVSRDTTKNAFIKKSLKSNETYYCQVVASTGSYSLMRQSATPAIKITTTKINYNLEESFENGLDQWNVQKGNPQVSKEQAHTGEYSLKIAGEYDVLEKTFADKLNGTVSVWYYDDMKETARKSQLMNVSDGTKWMGIGVDTSKSGGKDNYLYRIEGDYLSSGVARSEGWHQFKWDYTSGKDVKFYIDDKLVASSDKVVAFNKIELGDFWQLDATIGYYDDLIVKVNADSQITVETPLEVESGEEFQVVLGVDGMNDSVYAQDLTIKYDPNVFTFVEEEAIAPTETVGISQEAGSIRLLLATDKGIKDGNQAVRLNFKAYTSVTTTSAITIEDIQLGVIENGESSITKLESVINNIVVKKQENPIDKTVLNDTIREAEALSSQAVVGTNPGQYPQDAKDTLDRAIETAKKVSETSEDQETINQATATLKEAITIFKNAVIKESDGDISEDGKVDVADLALVAYYYKAKLGDANWLEAQKVDVNGDNEVNIDDLTFIASKIFSVITRCDTIGFFENFIKIVDTTKTATF